MKLHRSPISHNYTLIGQTPVPCDNLLEWGKWFHTADRVVKKETIAGILVSTVFLGVDHDFSGEGPPLLFETMTFSDDIPNYEQKQERCSTWLEAERQHRRVVARVRRASGAAQGEEH